jgi:hypothetical protein
MRSGFSFYAVRSLYSAIWKRLTRALLHPVDASFRLPRVPHHALAGVGAGDVGELPSKVVAADQPFFHFNEAQLQLRF